MENHTLQKFDLVDTLRWPAMPDPHDRYGMVWIWPRSKVRAFEQIHPSNAHGDGFLQFPYALAVFDRDDRHILSVVIEQTDYRVLSQLTGERISEFTGGKGGYLSPAMVARYDAHKHDELGPYEGSMEIDTVMEILVDIIADTLDLWDEPIRRKID
ncbi:hypothetical protein [Pleomorphochaeta sp. DL1XJH-081]|uniref:hypothetical protein n=1 Tax=Pleomorphochaeta sp. DL1XJH-081 TaxID=3409690 RepID=UPI003BB6997A